MPNAETKIPDIPRRNGKGKIWSHVRQAWFAEFPEEVVRQAFVCRLVNDYGFDLAQTHPSSNPGHSLQPHDRRNIDNKPGTRLGGRYD